MPIYEFECKNCKKIDEILTSDRNIEKIKCSMCGQESQKIISLSKFELQGIGWGKHNYDKKNVDIIEDGPENAIKSMQAKY